MLVIVLLSVVTTLNYLTGFEFFFVNTTFWVFTEFKPKFQDVNEENMSHLLVPKSQKVEVSRWSKKLCG